MLWNWVLLICISWHLEQKYAAWRVGLLWGVACIGGQLISAVWEEPCRVIVGASGGVFGIMGLFVADMIVNFRTIKRPILRSLLALLMLVLCLTEVKVTNTTTPRCIQSQTTA
jgi:membrane associated rhomboid family serine protease